MNLYAWYGYDYDSEDDIEIENPASVIPGKDIEIFDYEDDTYHRVQVISIMRQAQVIIEVYDYGNGEYRTFEMEDEIKAQESAFFKTAIEA